MKTQRGMGSVFKQPGSEHWWISYYVRQEGKSKRIRESTGFLKQADAVAILKKRTGQVEAGTFVEPVIRKSVRLSDLARLVTDNYRMNGLRSIRSLPGHFKRLYDHFGDILIEGLTTARIDAFKAEAIGPSERYPSGRFKAASINRSLGALKRGYKLARRAGIVVTEPVIEMLPERNARQGFVEDADFRRLLAELPEYLQDPVAFLYLSAWRKGEMQSLEWQDVDLADKMIRLRPERSKNGRGRLLVLSGELLDVIKRAHARRRIGCPFVFHYGNGLPIGRFSRAWDSAVKRAKLPGLIPHDLRRSAVRTFIRSGMDQTVAMARSGHVTVSTFQRYNIVSERDMRAAAEKLDAHLRSARSTSSGPAR